MGKENYGGTISELTSSSSLLVPLVESLVDSNQNNEPSPPATCSASEPERINDDRAKNNPAKQEGCIRKEVLEEAKLQFKLAGPLIAVSLLQYCLQVISVMFVGHLGELPLAGASLATSFAAVSGFSVLLGMSSALETLCGQAYGAKQYRMLGIHTQRAMVVLLILCLPLALMWFYTDNILMLIGQNHEIAIEAGKFTRPMIPSLFAYALLQCLTRFLQTQNIVISMMITSGFTALLHVLVCWSFVFKFGLGMEGAAWANTFSNWVNVILLGAYVKCSPAFAETWTGFSSDSLTNILSFLKLAVPSAFMICLEYWSFELVVILSGLLPNPQLETSVLSISLNTCWMVYQISVGLGAAISTRVANEMGAGRPKGARLAVRVMSIVALVEGAIVFAVTILVQNVWGKLYSNETEVIAYVARMMPLLALSDFLDGFQCVLSGAARGCGWQKLCAWINLFAYYGVAIPAAAILAFVVRIGGKGLWFGIILGLTVQIVALIVVNVLTNWDSETKEAIDRVETTSTNAD